MKGCIFFLLFLQYAIFYPAKAQISDDFSDGNFNEHPAWHGQTTRFIVNSENQLQLSAPFEAGHSYLSTACEVINNAEWSFYVKLKFNPSSRNYMDVYLVSDTQDLSAPVNGYFVRIGNSQDEVSLYKQSGDKSTAEKIIDGMDDRVDMSTVELNVKVSKNHESEWELLVDPDLNQSFISEGKVHDSDHFFSRFFGIYCSYTSTRSDKFFFDELFISGDAFTDSTPPEVDTLIVLSDSTVKILFNEKMRITTTENSGNYFVNRGIGSPHQIDVISDSSALLYFNTKFEHTGEYQISIHGVEDLFGNSINNSVVNFNFTAPYVVTFGDILITEIMADPTPGVDLPEYEYLEIHNPKKETFDLHRVTLIVGKDTARIPDLSIKPGEFIILCRHAAVKHFLNIGRTLKIANWPTLNNRGEQIILVNKFKEIIHAVNYEDTWYKSIEKDDGGYSLEMIDPDFPCKGQENWRASMDPSGGTPGKKNSVATDLMDLSAPEIGKITTTSGLSITISLNENVGPQEILLEDVSINPHLDVTEIMLQKPGFSEIYIKLDDEIKTKTSYELTLRNLADCAGNIQKATSSTFVLPELADSLDLIINEILFNPKPTGVDFVEIYNQSEKFIDLKDWTLANKDTLLISVQPFILEPRQFLVITENFSTLNNHYPGVERDHTLEVERLVNFNDDLGEVRLMSSQGQTIDFFQYKEDFHSAFLNDIEGVSLERISFDAPTNEPANWHSAASTVGFATPGRMNSQFLLSSVPSEEVVVEPKVFAPGNNGFYDFTAIKCRFSSPGNMASIQILDPIGRKIKTIISHQSIGAEENFKWEGLNDRGEEVQMGPYIVFLEIYNAKGLRKTYTKKVVVGKMLN